MINNETPLTYVPEWPSIKFITNKAKARKAKEAKKLKKITKKLKDFMNGTNNTRQQHSA